MNKENKNTANFASFDEKDGREVNWKTKKDRNFGNEQEPHKRGEHGKGEDGYELAVIVVTVVSRTSIA